MTQDDGTYSRGPSTSVPIHDIGTAIYLSPDVMGWAAEWGWSNPFAFYFAGRGGMLGDVSHDVVTAALGWFEPNTVKAMYSEGAAVAGPAGAAARMAEAHCLWGDKHSAMSRTSKRSCASSRNSCAASKDRPSRSSSAGATPHPATRRPAGPPSSCRSCGNGVAGCTWWPPRPPV